MEKETEILAFIDYLKERQEQITVKLEPYYERIKTREQSAMNLYGCATPGDNILLNENAAISTVLSKITLDTNLDDLEKSIKQNCETEQSYYKKQSYHYQLKVIEDYREKLKKCEIKRH